MGNIVNPANLGVADARRSDTIHRIKRQLDSLLGEIRRGANDVNGMRNDYMAERLEFLQGEADRLQAEIGRLNALGGVELIREMIPDIPRMEMMAGEPAPSIHDVITQRGAMLPQPVIVNRETLPVRHEGPPGRRARVRGPACWRARGLGAGAGACPRQQQVQATVATRGSPVWPGSGVRAEKERPGATARAHNSSGTIHGGCCPFLTALLNHRTAPAPVFPPVIPLTILTALVFSRCRSSQESCTWPQGCSTLRQR